MNLKRHLAIAVVLLGAFGLIAANLSQTYFATPVRSVVGRVESDPEVAKTFGSPVSVALLRSYELKRYALRHRATDVITFRTRVTGSAGEGELTLMVQNEDDQGWAGDYEVRTSNQSKLVNGSYQQEPVRVIVKGRFDANGVALPARKPNEGSEAALN